ncbi:MAG TPA: S8 family serine peptidase [Micromonosporaceae bacterium]|nr:S8 family serine peptidase [Micromonosporaceae bacterium]
MRRLATAAIFAAAIATVGAVPGVGIALTGAAGPQPAGAAAPGQIRSGGAQVIAGSYLVVLRDNTAADRVAELATSRGARIGHRYSAALHGFEVATDEATAQRLAAHPAVSYVERNSVHQIDTGRTPMATATPTGGTQLNAPWGLDRIDQRFLPLNGTYTYPNNGAGVRIYVMNTGIRFTHVEFGGRAVSGRDVIDNDNDASDCNGLGTHLAGIAGGITYGVAKSATLVAVRLVNCQGSASIAQVVAGIDWVTANAVKPAVALLTVGGSASATFDAAVRNSIASGVTYVVAAGSSNSDACNFSPGRVAEAITVSASDASDNKTSFTNFGTCVDMFAPGVSITSAWYTSNTATSTISGTSTAAAHVAGGAALLLAASPTWSPAQVAAGLNTNATLNAVNNAGTGTPNRLLYVRFAPPNPCSRANGANVAVPDFPNPAVTSTVTVSGCARVPSTAATVEVHILHPFRGDLQIDLLAPDGSAYRLLSPSADSGDDIHTTFVVNLSAELAGGSWRLRVADCRTGNTGQIDGWALNL